MTEQQRRFRDLLYKKLNRRYEILSIRDRTRREQIMTRLIDDIMATLKDKGPLNRQLYQNTKEMLLLDNFLRQRQIKVAPNKSRQDKHDGKYNRFINYHGLKQTVQNVRNSIDTILGQFPTIDKIISVGSGTGYLEKLIEIAFRQKLQMICIDPDPTQFSSEPIKRGPDYPTVDVFLRTRPVAPWNSIVLLNWPETRETHGAGYDVDAIRKLNPLAVIIIYELDFIDSGSAGSKQLHRMRDTDTTYDKETVVTFPHFDPVIFATAILQLPPEYAAMMATLTYTMEVWTREPVQYYTRSAQQSLVQHGIIPVQKKYSSPVSLRASDWQQQMRNYQHAARQSSQSKNHPDGQRRRSTTTPIYDVNRSHRDVSSWV